ncbi:2,5-didehydrogluconate reductase [Umbelopsis sp. PMI_123]|nr:2,5-didehydrogluconate reductase [Umbelopsis sp. PMI_123]
MSLTLQSTHKLNDGNEIPALGFGVYQSEPGDETEQAVIMALEAGYRHIDTASCYYNEESVGSALKKCNIPRSEIWITTKLWDTDQGYDKAKEACYESLRKLELDYVDLYLIHSPGPGKKLRSESWRALEDLQKEGKVRSIGVSNYGIHHLKEVFEVGSIKPVINQIEVTPYQVREELCRFCQENGVLVEAYSPLTMGLKLKEPRLNKIAQKYGKQPAQILIRWSLQRGLLPLPKSVKKQRIIDNSNVFDFDISAQDMEALTNMDEYLVTEWDPTKLP